ncbi:MAG: hypothetical protein FWF25_00755 [Propionibacteriaceae bacterium]|nr:hypothetical protein [Propionibacteriaceae bacterium]
MSQVPITPPRDQRALLQQAPVVPLDASGFTASVVGTVLLAVITVIMVATGLRGSWLYILVTATVIGLILIPYTSWHRWRAHRQRDDHAADPSLEN